MQYGSFDPERYLPTRNEALIAGERALSAIKYHSSLLKSSDPRDILEIGCASGSFLFYLRSLGHRVAGIEVQHQLVSHGRSVLGIDIEEGDWINASQIFSGRQFDLIVALDVIEHIKPEEVEEHLRVLSSLLRPGGEIIIRAPNIECPFVLPMFFGDLTHKWPYSVRLLTALFLNSFPDGKYKFWGGYPGSFPKRLLSKLSQRIFVAPLYYLIYYVFAGEWPQCITRNLYFSCRTER